MDHGLDDGRLIEASWSHPARFAELFDRRYVTVRAFCARRVGARNGDDVAGETFCRAFEHRRRYDVSRADARPWLYGIASNVIRAQHRSDRRGSQAYLRAAAMVDAEDPFQASLSSIDARRELAIVACALPSLPPDEVDALLMHAWEGLSYGEIAEAFDVPIGTVRSRLSRVRRRLRTLLDTNGPAVATRGNQTPPPQRLEQCP
jgi:RNA polymerase sigma factor (sigma-70 family)